ncbi:MAG: NADPH-dependent assimilatory sulfite reductase hemoprotein subunit [bacterium]
MERSKVEDIKSASHGLRGTIAETLPTGTDHFNEADAQLLKYHGIYQQDDRDLRLERKRQNLDKAYYFFTRTRLPGGKISAEQYLAHEPLIDKTASRSIRITTRQDFQIHGVPKHLLKEHVQRLNRLGATTWGGSGDIARNTMCTTAVCQMPIASEMQELAEKLHEIFLPHSSAYKEIWLDAPKSNEEEEPLYGKSYLPRKFKIAIALPPFNDVDIYAQDLGFAAHAPHGRVEGYTLIVGGGFGMTPSNPNTRPILGKPLFYIEAQHAVAAAIAMITLHRDFGNREDRKQARMKYLIENRGLDWFRKEVETRMGISGQPPKELNWETVADPLGWHEQSDGKLLCGVWVSQGRIKDTEQTRYRSAFRVIAQRWGFPMRLTPNCNLIFYNIEPDQREEVARVLREHGVADADALTEARKMSHACVALPTCGLAITESERVFSGVMDQIDAILRELKLEKEPILIRMTGCSNGCSRPYDADIAFVGKSIGKYSVYRGGSKAGDRLGKLQSKEVPLEDLAVFTRPYLEQFAKERQNGETFSAYWGRTFGVVPK